MENRGISTKIACCWLLLWLALLCPDLATAQTLHLARLSIDAPAAEVIAGNHDAALVEIDGNTLSEPNKNGNWWRLRSDIDIPADDRPQLVLENPFLNRIDAWLPGQSTPSRHALFGAYADARYSTRALVVDLPDGLSAGAPLWLRVDALARTPIVVSIQTHDAVHRADLTHVAWRSAVLATLLALAMLGLAFWYGSGERAHGYFAGMLVVAALYLACMGGEIRYLGWAAQPFTDSPAAQRLLGCAGVIFCNMFQHLYLDLPRQMPRANAVLMGLALWMLAIAIVNTVHTHAWVARAGNAGLAASALIILLSSAWLAMRGNAQGRVVLLSWLPLVVLVVVRAMEMMGIWQGAAQWTVLALDASFALAALGLTLGLTNKLLELRRDRDHASALASRDGLTGALSRHAIEQGLASTLDKAARLNDAAVSIAFVDLDHFKQINDQHGHAVGDQYLRYVVMRLRNCLRGRDLLGRYGGDEFLLVMPGTRRADAQLVAQRLCDVVSCRPIDVSGIHIHASVSIGIAEHRPHESAAALLERADVALYASKSAGRGRVSADQCLSTELFKPVPVA
jgi:diguanylate cyclase (GGDEF)-like protein